MNSTRAAYVEHLIHGGHARGVEAQRLVERSRILMCEGAASVSNKKGGNTQRTRQATRRGMHTGAAYVEHEAHVGHTRGIPLHRLIESGCVLEGPVHADDARRNEDHGLVELPRLVEHVLQVCEGRGVPRQWLVEGFGVVEHRLHRRNTRDVPADERGVEATRLIKHEAHGDDVRGVKVEHGLIEPSRRLRVGRGRSGVSSEESAGVLLGACGGARTANIQDMSVTLEVSQLSDLSNA